MSPLLLRHLRYGGRDDEPAREVVCLHTSRAYPVVSSLWRWVCVRVRYGSGLQQLVWKGAAFARVCVYMRCAWRARHTARLVRACMCVCVWCTWCARRTVRIVRARVCIYVVRFVRATHHTRGARACVCVCSARGARGKPRTWCAWCARRTACVVRARVCVCVVHVVRTVHRAHYARACLCTRGARGERGTPLAWCARARVCVCVCVWCA